MLQTIIAILFLIVIAVTISPKLIGIEAPRWKIFMGGWFIIFIVYTIGGSPNSDDSTTQSNLAQPAIAATEQQGNDPTLNASKEKSDINMTEAISGEATTPTIPQEQCLHQKCEDHPKPKANKISSTEQNASENGVGWGISSSKQCLTNYCVKGTNQYASAPENDAERAERKAIIAECVEGMRQLILLGSEADNCK